jgi:hypothetical protein
MQHRKVECFADNNERLSDTGCDPKLKPEETQMCKQECHEWRIVSYGNCSVKCGYGWRIRHFECQYKDGRKSNLCRESELPIYYESCYSNECPRWHFGSWSVCSSRCKGLRKRLVVCRNSDGIILDERFCDATLKPSEIENCTDQEADCEQQQQRRVSVHKYAQISTPQQATVLNYSEWSNCTASCGNGVRTRRAVCRLAHNLAIELPIENCNKEKLRGGVFEMKCYATHGCSYELVETWTKCSSNECGIEGQVKLVKKCLEVSTRTYVNLSLCGVKEVEEQSRICYKPCSETGDSNHEWTTSDWQTVI